MSTEETHDLEKLGTEWAAASSQDLSGLFGIEVTISGPSLQHARRDELLPESDVIVTSRCEVAEEDGAGIWMVLPLRGAQVLATAQNGKQPEELAEVEAREFDGDVADGYTGAIDVCAGILGRVLDEEAGLPAIQLGDTHATERADCDEALASGSYRRMRFEFEAGGFPKETFDIFFEADLATRWFGQMGASPSATGEGETLDLHIAIVDPCEESREDFGNIAEGLGAQVMSFDPQELGPEAKEELAEVGWVVLAWDLGGRSGLDLLDALRRDKATAHLEFAIASPAPTRPIVEAALRWGARTVLFQPWEAEEIRERLLEEA